MGIGKHVETFLPGRFTMICRSYGANRNLATDNYGSARRSMTWLTVVCAWSATGLNASCTG
jgi:hypothetical protein